MSQLNELLLKNQLTAKINKELNKITSEQQWREEQQMKGETSQRNFGLPSRYWRGYAGVNKTSEK